jgi:hypothetical protein
VREAEKLLNKFAKGHQLILFECLAAGEASATHAKQKIGGLGSAGRSARRMPHPRDGFPKQDLHPIAPNVIQH